MTDRETMSTVGTKKKRKPFRLVGPFATGCVRKALSIVTLTGGALSLSLWSQPAHALVTIETGFGALLASGAAYLICRNVPTPPSKDDCKVVAMAVDPIFSENVTQISLGWSYDPSLFSFNPALSGPLAPFGVGGTIFPVDASIGTKPIGILDADTFSPASLLPGSTLEYITSPGFVRAVLSFEDPGISVSSVDRNFFVFAFDSLGGGVDPNVLVTYTAPDDTPTSDGSGPSCSSDTPVEDVFIGEGAGTFRQTDFSCKFPSVPGPIPLLGVGAAFGYSRKLRKRIKASKSPAVMSTIG